MKNVKKVIALLLAAVLLVAASVMGTIAYLTDSDADVNVMSAGNVYIVQNETDRYDEAYVDGQKLLPLTKGENYLTKDYAMIDTDGETALNVWGESLNNEIDKFVSVTNTGTEAAYVRTILLFETVKSYEEGSDTVYTDLHDHFLLINGDYTYLKDADGNFVYVTIGENEYAIAVKTYENALEPEATTTASLRQFALTSEAGNEFYDFFGPEYDIIVFSQAVQAQGFENAEEALNEAFGEVTSANVAEWANVTAIKTNGENNVINPNP